MSHHVPPGTDSGEDAATVAEHYRRANLLALIESAVTAAGKTVGTVTAEDLAPLDEFHIGGRHATADLLQRIGVRPGQTVIDVGCGLGGPARLAAASLQCRVTGIDLTEEYVRCGNTISSWLGMDNKVELVHGDALAMPFATDLFDAGYLIHAGMNIRDKRRLFGEAARVLRRRAYFAVYDVMRTSTGVLEYPVPWATTPLQCALATPDEYRAALAGAGLVLRAEFDRRTIALAYFERQRAIASNNGPVSPIGLQILMGDRRRDQVSHMSDAVARGVIAPVLMIVERV